MSSGDFTLTVLNIPDVGRGVGLALVLQTPAGHTYLYDTGTGYPAGDGWEHDHNSGRDTVAPFLAERGITELDGVIISHAHYDHFGGLLWLVDHMPIRRLIDSGYEFGGFADNHYTRELADYEDIRRRFQAMGAYQTAVAGDQNGDRHLTDHYVRGNPATDRSVRCLSPCRYQAAVAGDRLDLDPQLQVEVIAPPAEFFSDPGSDIHEHWNPAAHYLLNSNSLMLRIRHGEVVFLLPGDIEKDDQARFLLPSVSPNLLRCDVLIAPGHGLHTHPDFVAATQPQLVAVSLFKRWLSSCSARDGFGEVGAEVMVTGRDGTIEIGSNGATWQARSVRHSA